MAVSFCVLLLSKIIIHAIIITSNKLVVIIKKFMLTSQSLQIVEWRSI